MASKAKHRRDTKGDESREVTEVCSINGSGIIFVCSRKFPVSSELSVTVQIFTLGNDRNWKVNGLVVECRNVKRGRHARYQVTLLCSGLPDGLEDMASGETTAAHAFIPLKNCPMFGLN